MNRRRGFPPGRLERAADPPERLGIQTIVALARAERPAEAQIIGAEPGQGRDVGQAQGARETTDEPELVYVRHEPSELGFASMAAEPARTLVGGIQHDPPKPGPGEGREIGEIGIAIGHQHGHEPYPARGHGPQRLEDRRPARIGEEADLDDVDTTFRDPFGGLAQELRLHRQIARGGRERHASGESGDHCPEKLGPPSAERARPRILEVEQFGTERERGFRLLEIGHAREQGRRSIGQGKRARTHGRSRPGFLAGAP